MYAFPIFLTQKFNKRSVGAASRPPCSKHTPAINNFISITITWQRLLVSAAANAIAIVAAASTATTARFGERVTPSLHLVAVVPL